MITAPSSTIPVCACCGSPDKVRHANGFLSPYRCQKHADRNPCLVEGCARTRAAPMHDGKPWLANNQHICAIHWRAYVPPRSRVRQAYHAHWRRGDKAGWTIKHRHAFDRFWQTLVTIVRRRADHGRIDEAQINRLMGWD